MDEKKIDIMDLLALAWKRLWIIVLAFVVCAVAAYSYCSFFLVPRYRATASVIATNGAVTVYNENKNSVSATDISASLYLSHTITDVLKTPDIYKRLADELGTGYDYANLMARTTIERRSEESLFVDVHFSSTDPKEAMRVANKFVEISCDYITDFIPYSKAMVASTAIKASMTYPRTVMATGVAGVAGAVISFVIIYIVEALNRSIKGEDDFAASFDIPLLGSVPDFENAEAGGYRKAKGGYGSGY